MAIFSRGKRTPQPADSTDVAAAQREDLVEPAEAVEAMEPAVAMEASEPAEAPAASEPAETAGAAVPISVSSFRGLGAKAPRRPAPERAPAQTQSVPGLRDNVLLAASLARITAAPTPADLIDVARQLMQGQLFLRVKGDARALLSQGRPLPFALATLGEKTYVVAYSNGRALQSSVREDGDADTSAVGQPVLSILRQVLAGTHDGLLIDPSSAPARAVLSRDLLERMVTGADPALTVKTLLAAERSATTAAEVTLALGRTRFWVAVNRVGETGRLGIAEGRNAEGERFIELYSHPLEVLTLGRGDQPAPMTAAQLAKAVSSDETISGAIVDPAGPWIRLTRADLAALPVA